MHQSLFHELQKDHHQIQGILQQFLSLLQKGIFTVADHQDVLILLQIVSGGDGSFITTEADFSKDSLVADIPRSWTHPQRGSHTPINPLGPRVCKAPFGLWTPVFHETVPPYPHRDTGAPLDRFDFGEAQVVRLAHPHVGQLFVGICWLGGSPSRAGDRRHLLNLLTPHLQGALSTRRAIESLSEAKDRTLAKVLEEKRASTCLKRPKIS